MDYRSINRVLLFNKALKRWCDRSGFALRQTDCLILLSLSYGCGSIAKVEEYLARLGRSVSPTILQRSFRLLLEVGWIGQDERRKYRITVAGEVALKEFERMLRNERYDKPLQAIGVR
jgi:hypothetical protein